MKIRFLSLAALILLTPALSSAQQAIHDDKYKPVTRENLSQLYWRMGAMDIKNDSDIDNFIMLNRCDIYEESYQDDLAWHEIRKKARVSIAKNQDKFSRYLKVIRPISLGRYNPDTEEFALTRPVATTNFEIRVSNENTWDCNRHATALINYQ